METAARVEEAEAVEKQVESALVMQSRSSNMGDMLVERP